MRMRILKVIFLCLVFATACARNPEATEVIVIVEEVIPIEVEEVVEIEEVEEAEEVEEEIEEIIEEEEYEEAYEPEPEFIPVFKSEPLPEHIIEFIEGRTFHETTRITHDDLTYLTVSFVDFEDNDRIGHMIVAAEIGEEVLEIFREIYESRFPIYSIKLIDYFDASDYYSMAANNSSAFNWRYIAGTTRLSRHAFGMAIDINPVQNPYLRGERLLPAAGEPYLDRSYVRPGMIIPGDAVYTAFVSRGWTWGGNWTVPRDYHHFELSR